MKALKGLLFTDDGNISKGAIAFWIVFGVLIWYWIRAGLQVTVNVTIPDAPESLQAAFIYLLMYNTATKVKRHFDLKNQVFETGGENETN